ncbi:cytochrome-c oxidase, cbb3-type subunit III [endosymbiont of unidentified scaly snail isolate Monju]|uniref:cytochrome-c oxidase, cbb3-type subunit III n=1 Tax=endosymbiont of unidentified scaly snail isolate Monju TaxID=1248727 RepID=UPI0003891F61|nr:cytochrome-c oxidase, cbb3-type subunit III [endosymbiont of unidentified scaly snail isolate Monju]BAN68237.1 cytochrome c oxidase, cbb3-type, subunit III [endosymbiont of unidentified scaly snail isolate Monju]
MADQSQHKAVQTTGHAWDGDLQEFNNPLPRWWLWTFYATVVFAIVYWILYPAWPVGKSFTKGLATTSFVDADGKEVTTHWNTRAEFIRDMQSGEEALKQKAYLEKVAGASYEEILNDPDMMAFTQSLAKVLFADNCAACHGLGGTPAEVGNFPNLRDDAWLWGGSIARIEQTIRKGRLGYMPSFGKVLSDEEIEALANYVLSLSGHNVDKGLAARGDKLFHSEQAGCYYCHTNSGKGLYSQGSANLTDQVWTVADVNGAGSVAEKVERVKSVIRSGIQRRMPAWEGRLSDEEIKLLTVYVHGLGGGQ